MTNSARSTVLARFTLPGLGLAMARSLILVLFVTLVPSVSAAKAISKHMSCQFTSGTTTAFEDGVFSSSPPKPFAFEISDIDLEDQSASLVGNGRRAPGHLKIVRAINANHFIEVVNEGYMNLTTIYDVDPATGKFPAVHSRHLGILGQPIFAQYTGLCTAK